MINFIERLGSSDQEFDKNSVEKVIVGYNYHDDDKSYACTIFQSSVAMAFALGLQDLQQLWKKLSLPENLTSRFTEFTPLTQPYGRSFYHALAFDNQEEVWCVLEVERHDKKRVTPSNYFDSEEEARLFALQLTWIWWYNYLEVLNKSEENGSLFTPEYADKAVLYELFKNNLKFHETARKVTMENSADELTLKAYMRTTYYVKHFSLRFPDNLIRHFERILDNESKSNQE